MDLRPSYHHDLSGVRYSIIGFGARRSVFWAGFRSFFCFLEPRFPHLFNENDAVDSFELSIGAEVLEITQGRPCKQKMLRGRWQCSCLVSEESFLPNALSVYICTGFQPRKSVLSRRISLLNCL